MKCPSCGTAAEGGRFCANCGTALGKPECPRCGNTPPAGARFCNQCGTTMGASPTASRTSGNQPVWWVAGALLLGLVLVIAYPVYGPGRAAPAPPAAVGPAAGPSPPDLTSMSSREAADRLFDRVMRAESADNATEVVQFLPMAIAAYGLVETLDADGRFHWALLHLMGQFTVEALENAEETLSQQPDHLFGLATAGDASLALGDSASAREYYRRWWDAYEAERAKNLVEYQEHEGVFPEMRATAEVLGRND